jgi:hypothetical protein
MRSWLALAIVVAAAIPSQVSAAHAGETPCSVPENSAYTQIWWSPAAPTFGSALRLLAVREAGGAGNLRVTLPDGAQHTLPTSQRGGPPFSFYAELAVPQARWIRVELMVGDAPAACRRIPIRASAPRQIRRNDDTTWRSRQAWSRAYENFFSVWIERLFDVPADGSLAFPSLAPVLRDKARNFLWGYLELGEDDPKNRDVPRAAPDCADLPYYLRAYFSWKLGLPFALRDCDRGTADRAPKCGPIFDNESPDRSIAGRSPLGRFSSFLRILANRVHSGSARTALGDDQTDFYPVALERRSLRPGTIYADPYGHVLMVARWVDQTPEHPGLLLAVDGQPDDSIGSKRFWEGTFLFVSDLPSAGPGFKAFRPVLRDPRGQLAQPSNQALAADPRFSPYADEQSRLAPDAFYARVAKLINPDGLDARAVYTETMNALVEQLVTRVGSVDNGERYMRAQGDPVVPMPAAAKIFETTGAWEDFATPSRDMRLLIALRVLTELPRKITLHPEIFLLGGRKPTEVRAEIEGLHEREIRARGIEYRRSDGSPFHLSVADVLARRAALEMAYNPNDCIEIRWGATPDTGDYATCGRHAPDEQRARMQEYRTWFHQTRRPPR